MNQKNTNQFLLLGAVVVSLFCAPRPAFSQGTAFTYQGRLDNSGAPANGTYDLRFKLFTDPFGNNQMGSTVLTNGVPVASGLFTVTVDFGSGTFNGSNYWLEVDVRTNGPGSYASLSPLQAITPVPYALFAENANGGGLAAGTYTNPITLNNPADSFTGTFLGNGGGLTNVNAATLGGLTAGSFWKAVGNSGTVPGTNFVGTTDNQPLELWVNQSRAFRLEPGTNNSGAPNVIGGSPNNAVGPGITGATIAGGGATNSPVPNLVLANFGTIGGGSANSIQLSSIGSTIGGGQYNIIQTNAGDATIAGGYNNNIAPAAAFSTISGGMQNAIQAIMFNNNLGGYNSIIAGGLGNTIGTPYATISGGSFHSIGTNSNSGTVGGGYYNRIANNTFDSTIGGGSYSSIGTNSYGSTISGGSENSIGNNATAPTISGGYFNSAGASYATVSGGYNNSATIISSTVSGGYQNYAGADSAAVSGGVFNRAAGPGSVVSGGVGNLSSNYAAVVSGGVSNNAAAPYACVSGGTNNSASGLGASVGGGINNSATVLSATVGGGYGNVASGGNSVIPGGAANMASGVNSFAAGSGAHALHDSSFVWSDGASFSSTTPNEFSVRATGGMRCVTSGVGLSLDGPATTGDIHMSAADAGYHHVDLSGGNSIGFLYGSYPGLGDGVHMGYNYYYDAGGTGHCINTGGATSRISVGYGVITLCVGGVNQAPSSTMVYADASGVCITGLNLCSDRNVKQDFAPISTAAILEKVSQLPLSEWSYKEQAATRHIGPMAQDFRAAFELGTDDKHIAPIDEGGIALAAIQGLNQKMETENAALRAENADLKARLEKLERLVNSQNGGTR